MAKSRTPPPAAKAAAAAAGVALAGAAAAGGKLAHDRRAKPVTDDPRRAYRLRRDEHVPDGIRRIARGQLLNAHEELGGASKHTLGEAVHDTRKRLKRLRACLRLTRDALGEETYDRENTALRMAGRRLSGARDAQVLVETLDALAEHFADVLPRAVTERLRARLQDEHERATAEMRDDDATLAATLGELEGARTRAAGWTLEPDGFDALQPGLRRIYRRGRKRVRTASADTTTENLHEARKRVKDLWHATQIVRPAAPKKLKKVSRRAHDVADLLGDDHDLAMLREYAETHPQCFDDESSRRALLAVLDRRRDALQRDALKRARKLYTPSPKRFVGAIGRGWRKRAAAHPRPLAG
jgi:CHAD domain-containing protein